MTRRGVPCARAGLHGRQPDLSIVCIQSRLVTDQKGEALAQLVFLLVGHLIGFFLCFGFEPPQITLELLDVHLTFCRLPSVNHLPNIREEKHTQRHGLVRPVVVGERFVIL